MNEISFGNLNLKVLIFLICCLSLACQTEGKVLKVLAIGNSFSEDSVEQNLYEITAELGDTLIIGNAYIGGCSIDRHVNNLKNGLPEYSYRKIENGILKRTENQTLRDIIKDEDWDIISLQQVSGLSGRTSSYSNLPILKQLVEENALNKDLEIVWHNTWAYANDYRTELYEYYGSNQDNMLDSIINVAQTIIPANNIKRIIPSGIAIQNARKEFGDILNRDGYHLAIPLGRFVAASAWAGFLTGKDVRTTDFKPDGITDEDARKAREAAFNAVNCDFTLLNHFK